jgi:hypothetical protein
MEDGLSQDFCSSCDQYGLMVLEYRNFAHVWLRCTGCGKMLTRRVQESRGVRWVNGIGVTGTQFSGEIKLRPCLVCHFETYNQQPGGDYICSPDCLGG